MTTEPHPGDRPALLIVTNRSDVHADELIRRFHDSSVTVFRLNTEDVFKKVRVTLEIAPDGQWSGRIENEAGRQVCLQDVKVAWIRRPDYSHGDLEALIDKFIVAEIRALIDCILAIPDIKFINEDFDARRAKTKAQQLIASGRLGIKVPRTIVTNSASDLKKFVDAAYGDLLVKPIYTSNFCIGGVKHGIFSRKVSREELLNVAHLVVNSPTQIQDYIEKAYELRITVVGDNVFPIRIDSQTNEVTRIDWRVRTSLNPHSIMDIPREIGDFCRKFVKCQNLVYGAMDFIVQPDGEFVFLENNPSGQYLWLESETGAPITEALVDYIEAALR